MGNNIIAIITSDWHLHNFPAFDNPKGSRLSQSLKAARYIMGKAEKYQVPVLFCGDLFHNPKEVENDVITEALGLFIRLSADSPFIAIAGNHDQKEKHTVNNNSPHYLTGLSLVSRHLHVLSGTIHINTHGMTIYGIPYFRYESEWVEAIKQLPKPQGKRNILLLHGNAPGAVTSTGQTIDDCELPNNLNKFFKDWDLVLFGHIHKPQKLSTKCYMVGSPIHQNRGDEGTDMGYWVLYGDMSMVFKPLNNLFPEFKTGTGDTKDYITPITNTHLEGLSDSTSQVDLSDRKGLAKAYMKHIQLKNKAKRLALTQILNQV